jgi:UDP-N-acetylmuramoylalanine--D-glutamate ligase
MDFRGRRVTIMGLGHFGGGVEAARWFARNGAEVTVTDLADQQTLAESLRALQGEPIARFHLGGHREEDFRDAGLVVVNPAVRPDNPFLRIARESGTRLTTDIALFTAVCPAPIIGVTGSNGKSTTAAMIATILRTAGRRTWLGGNIGESLLNRLPWIVPEEWVVLELSSFQLWHLGPNVRMPRIAVVTGCSPNHLDWHRDYADYVAAKQRILLGQTRHDWAVLNTHDAEVSTWQPMVRGRLVPLPAPEEIPPLAVPGQHNRINAACAAAAAQAAGCPWGSIRQGLAEFSGLPQRLELVGSVAGRRFYNDSTSTTPESTIAALKTFRGPVWLLAGGKDKGLDFGDLAAAMVEKARGAGLFGSVRRVLHGWVTARDPQFACITAETMAEALRWCWEQSRPGETIVLSPGAASGDQFRNFRQRGQRFVELVRDLDQARGRGGSAQE